ncbi:hypothetical protein [Actinokineospora inagensis]|uniref:hypothetical protein n=1 Tax=Actinokineospora inagensis TaxID=103730 RepID=UPI000684075E|nr:hypothetical protein [Actinokineospora inagensis]
MNHQVTDRLRDAARVVGAPVWRRLRPRIELIAQEHATPAAVAAARAHSRVDALVDELGALRAELTPEIDDLGRRVDELESTVDWLNGEHRRIAPQLAAVEARLAELERRPPAVEGAVSEDEIGSVAALVEEIRVEHARVRTRLGLVARYEERITRLEDAQGD